jgi:hypothetical protein
MKISAYFLLCFCFCALSFAGCDGGGETKVIEPPAAADDASAMEGVDEDEYNKAMEESMNQQGN